MIGSIVTCHSCAKPSGPSRNEPCGCIQVTFRASSPRPCATAAKIAVTGFCNQIRNANAVTLTGEEPELTKPGYDARTLRRNERPADRFVLLRQLFFTGLVQL